MPLPDPGNLTDKDIGILVCMARHRLGPGQEARENLRAFCQEHGAEVGKLTGESEEDWAEGTRLAQAVVDEYGHLYDKNGVRIADAS